MSEISGIANNSLTNNDKNMASKKIKNRIKHQQLKINSTKSKIKKRPWSEQEDYAIDNLVKEFGDKSWSLISQKLYEKFKIKNRSGKQCRERWHNHLDPQVIKNNFSAEEERILFEQHDVQGNKWAEIALKLKGRTDNIVKNHFYSTLRKQERRISKYCKKKFLDQNEVSIQYLYQLIKDNNIDPSIIDNENLRSRVIKLQNIDLSKNIQESFIPTNDLKMKDTCDLRRSDRLKSKERKNYKMYEESIDEDIKEECYYKKAKTPLVSQKINKESNRQRMFFIKKSFDYNEGKIVKSNHINWDNSNSKSIFNYLETSKTCKNIQKNKNKIFKIEKPQPVIPILPRFSNISLFSENNFGFDYQNNLNIQEKSNLFPSLFRQNSNIQNDNKNLNENNPINHFMIDTTEHPISSLKSKLMKQNSNIKIQSLRIDPEIIQNEPYIDPLNHLAELYQNQNFLNIYSSKNQYFPFTPNQYFNEFSRQGTPMELRKY